MGSERVTLSQYRALEEGMPYGEVVRLLGREGTLDSRTDGSDGPVVASYYWWNDNKSYMEAAFRDDRLVYMNQSRLGQPRTWPGSVVPPRPAGARFERIPYVTLRQFRALERGMSYGEVVRLLGREGTPDSRTDGFDGPVVASYHWWNDNNSYVEATFENDRLVYKNQSRLRQVDPRRLPPLRLRSPGGDAGLSGHDAEKYDRLNAALAGPHKFLRTWLPFGGTLLVVTIGFLAFWLGQGPPEPTDIDLFLASGTLSIFVLLLAAATRTTDPWDQLARDIKTYLGMFAFIVVMMVVTGVVPVAGAFLWWLIFLFWCWIIRDPSTDAAMALILGFLAAVSLAGAVLALI